MKILAGVIALTLALTLALALADTAFAATAEPVTLTAADGVQIFADWYQADQPKALILLFHQAGSNRSEYATIAPRLVHEGYSALAIDQRSGGERFGHSNQTVTTLGHSSDYLDAEKDLEAALAWAVSTADGTPVVLCGSSYSASLVFLVAARHPEQVAAVMAFSPGEYFSPGNIVRKAASRVTAPVFVTSAQDASEITQAKQILDATAAKSKTQYLPVHGGVHGASTLRADRNPHGADENWQAVLAFLVKLH